MRNIRILIKNIRDGFKNVIRNFSLSLASISCITVTLLIVAFAIVGSYNVENFTKVIRDDFTIVVYMNNSNTEETEAKIKNEINGLSNIESIIFNSKKDIANEMKEESEIFNTIISSWSDSENPLYDTYLVKVKNSEKISNTASKIEKIEGVEMVRYGEGMIFLDHRFTIPNFPSRLLSYMQAKIPVLAVTDPNTDIGNVIVEGGFGWWCESNNTEMFNENIESALNINEDQIIDIKEKEWSYLIDNYSTTKGYNTIIARIRD